MSHILLPFGILCVLPFLSVRMASLYLTYSWESFLLVYDRGRLNVPRYLFTVVMSRVVAFIFVSQPFKEYPYSRFSHLPALIT